MRRSRLMLLVAAIVGFAFAPGAYAVDSGVDEVAVAVAAAVETATDAPAVTDTPVDTVEAPAVDTPPPAEQSKVEVAPAVDTPPPVDAPPVIQEPIAAVTADVIAPPPPPDSVVTATEPVPAPADPALSAPLDTSPPSPIEDPIVVPVDIAPAIDIVISGAVDVVAAGTADAGGPASFAVVSEPSTPVVVDEPAPVDPFTPGGSAPIVQPLSVLIDPAAGPLTIITGTTGRPFLPGEGAPLVVQEVPPTEATPMLPWGRFGPIMSSGDGPGSSSVAGLLALFMGLNPFAPQDGKAGFSPPPTLAVLVLGSMLAAFAFMMFPLRDRRRFGPSGYAALALRPG